MNTALSLTMTDLANTLSCASRPTRSKRVIDEDSGKQVGAILFTTLSDNRGEMIEWSTPHNGGFAVDEADALAKIERAILARSAEEAFEAAYRAEVDALPEPIRSL
ncbi:hypothetical protein, partial [Mesorhizobium sp. Z1-4]|uniref:hypothetical protein n=1 Tax=Mesorhizobium sp. Z1-4 TaxID=2448478 RepID=UPI0013E01616